MRNKPEINELMPELVKLAETEQNVEFSTNINFTDLVGCVCWGRLKDGRTFLSRLISVEGKRLWFVTKSGQLRANHADEIAELRMIEKPKGRALKIMVVDVNE